MKKKSRKLDFCLKGTDLSYKASSMLTCLAKGGINLSSLGLPNMADREPQFLFKLNSDASDCVPQPCCHSHRGFAHHLLRCDMQLQNNNRCSWNNDVVILIIGYVWLTFFGGVASKVGPMPIFLTFSAEPYTLIFWPFMSVFISHLCLCGLKAFLMEQKNSSPRFLWIKIIQTYGMSHLQRMDPMWSSEGGCQKCHVMRIQWDSVSQSGKVFF